jgi:hypothetical protein
VRKVSGKVAARAGTAISIRCDTVFVGCKVCRAEGTLLRLT